MLPTHKLVEDGLVKVLETDTGEKIVNARDLHKSLEVKTRYADWIKRRIEGFGFIENEDYITV